MPNNEATPTLEFLGQKFPLNLWTVLIIFILAVVILGLALGPALINNSGVEFTAGTYTYKVINGVVSRTSQERLYIFWTPSALTEKDIIANKEALKDYYRAGDESGPEGRVIKFADLLLKMGARGYNRLETYGQGSSPAKHGYLWRLTVDPNNERFSRENFVRAYSQFWNRTENIYVEEYDFSAKSR